MVHRHPCHIRYGTSIACIVLARLERAWLAIRPIEQSDLMVLVPMAQWAEVAEAARLVGLQAKTSPGGRAACEVVAEVQTRLKTLYWLSRQAVRIPMVTWDALVVAMTAIGIEDGVSLAMAVESYIERGECPEPQ